MQSLTHSQINSPEQSSVYTKTQYQKFTLWHIKTVAGHNDYNRMDFNVQLYSFQNQEHFNRGIGLEKNLNLTFSIYITYS